MIMITKNRPAFWLTLLALAACSNDRDIQWTPAIDAITFSAPFTQKTTSRANGDIDNSCFASSKFKVWGGPQSNPALFDGTEVFWADGAWIYTDTKHWEASSQYSFAAIAPTDAISQGSYAYASAHGFVISDIPICANASEGIDYLVSNRTDTDYSQSSSGVQLEFRHILSRLKVQAKYTSDDENLMGVTIRSLSINLPQGTAEYSQALASGPSLSDAWVWTITQNSQNFDIISEPANITDSYAPMGQGFFVAPTPADIPITINVAYDIEINAQGTTQSNSYNQSITLSDLSSFKQGFIYTLLLNIKPNDVSGGYIEFKVKQQVADLTDDNAHINESGQAFILSSLSQVGDNICATIDPLGNDTEDGYYQIISIQDALGKEVCQVPSNFIYSPVADNQYRFLSGVNGFLDAQNQYSVTISDRHGNLASGTLTPVSDMGGASMQWTITAPPGFMSFAIPFPESGSTFAEYLIDWGDGSTISVPKGTSFATNDDFTHTYSGNRSYTLIIKSAIGDYSQKQIDPIAFGAYRTSINTTGYRESDHLISVDTPLLNMGAIQADYLFDHCRSLTSIPSELFCYNSQLKSLNYGFRATSLSSIPAGLLDYLINVEEFRETFREIQVSQSLPQGLFAKNLKAWDFFRCFYFCQYLKLNSNLFLDNDTDESSRFAQVRQTVDFSNMFNSSTDASIDQSSVPNLWKYAYPHGFTWKSSMPPFSGCRISSSSTIPSEWHTASDTTSLSGYVAYPY